MQNSGTPEGKAAPEADGVPQPDSGGKRKQRGRGRQAAAATPPASGGATPASGEGGQGKMAATPSPSKEQAQNAAENGDKGAGAVQDGEAANAAPQKSKAQLKAERRALQEAQRAAKAQKKTEAGGGGGAGGGSGGGGGGGGGGKKAEAPKKVEASKKQEQPPTQAKKEAARVPDAVKADDPTVQRRLAKRLEKQQVPQRDKVSRTVRLFNHLPQYTRGDTITEKLPFSSSKIHPAVVKLGVQYANDVVCGSNARCTALLLVLAKVIKDYVTPPQKDLSRDLEHCLKPYISFLNQCRPMSVSMGSAIKHLKMVITQLEPDTPDQIAKDRLLETLTYFRKDKIEEAARGIAHYATMRIDDGDVVLIHGSSSLIQVVLQSAKEGMPNHTDPKVFRVIIVNSRPRNEGIQMLRQLRKLGIECMLVDSVTAVTMMKQATKVLLGAHALLANGYVMSRIGCSAIATAARDFNVPVLVCCETYKFYERVQTDAFVLNELADPSRLVEVPGGRSLLPHWEEMKSLNLLNLAYDITPPDLISALITELGPIPCSSVPVVLRVQQGVSDL